MYCASNLKQGGGEVPRGVLPENMGGGVRRTPSNPYPILDQNM